METDPKRMAAPEDPAASGAGSEIRPDVAAGIRLDEAGREAGAAGANGGVPSADDRPSLGQVALRGLCPACGARTLFAGWIAFAPRCRACGLDFERFNVGDGPAAFLTLLVGGLVTVLAIWLQLALAPPFWVHVLLWVPLTFGLVLLGLRTGKAALLAIEFARRAGEAGRSD